MEWLKGCSKFVGRLGRFFAYDDVNTSNVAAEIEPTAILVIDGVSLTYDYHFTRSLYGYMYRSKLLVDREEGIVKGATTPSLDEKAAFAQTAFTHLQQTCLKDLKDARRTMLFQSAADTGEEVPRIWVEYVRADTVDGRHEAIRLEWENDSRPIELRYSPHAHAVTFTKIQTGGEAFYSFRQE